MDSLQNQTNQTKEESKKKTLRIPKKSVYL
jgi:hypothetical protein